MRKNNTFLYILGLIAVLTVAACDLSTVYTHYQQVTIAGWERNDTLSFYIPPVQKAGTYREDLGLRISGNYPFTALTLVVDQTVVPSGKKHSDVINCKLMDQKGNAKGRGVSRYQYQFHLNTLQLKEGDSLHVTIRHEMKREILPGISDIGLSLTRQ